MKNRKFQVILLYLTLFAGMGIIAVEVFAFYYWHQIVIFTKLRTLAFILWLLSFIWLVEKPRVMRI
ncbi:MAG: hypothetical protein QME64_04740, partial [bacterium]|nr:hypothetical protein [bacterium]